MLAIAALLLSIAAAPQEIPAPRIDQTIEVELVNVDVVITDKKGNRIKGLTREDFVIKENGRIQPITNFAEYRSGIQDVKVTSGVAAPAQSAPQAQSAPPRKRTIVVFIERFKLPSFRVDPMFAAIRSTLRDVVRPGDDVAVYRWDDGLTEHLGFTGDPAKLDQALAEIEKQSVGVEANYIEMLRRSQELEAAFYKSLESSPGANKGGFAAAAREASEAEYFDEQNAALRQLHRIRRKTFDLRMLMRTIGDSPGKKIVLMATHRLGLYAGAEYFMDGEVPPFLRGVLTTEPEREALMRTANTYGVTLYPVYPAGLGWTPRVSALEGPREDIFAVRTGDDLGRSKRDNNILMNETASLNEIAQATGGMLAWGHKDIIQLMPRLEDDLDTYYSLAFRPAPGTKRGKIEIDTKDRRYVVRARREYVARDANTRMEDRVVANLNRPVEGATIPLQAEFGPYQRQSRYVWTVPLKIRIPVSALTALAGDGGRVGEFSVYVAVGGSVSVLSDVQHRTQRFKITDDQAAQAEGAYFTYEFTLRVRPQAGRASIGVIDEVSKEFGAQVVDLPNFPTIQ